jgi:hypothetical protein
MTTSRETLHQMVESLPESEWDAAARFLFVLRLRAMRASDDEPLSDDDVAAVAEARQAVIDGHLIPHTQIQRDHVS